MKRIGIFGGSFNPVHHGHLLAARAAFERLKLDELVFVPCAQSAYGKKLWPAALRLKLLRAALRGAKGFAVSAMEIKRGGVSRSIDTLRAMQARAGKGTKFFLLMGADQALEFPRWKEALELSKLSKICVLERPGSQKSGLIHRKYSMQSVGIPKYEISSSEIRTRLKNKLPIDWLVPEAVAKALGRS